MLTIASWNFRYHEIVYVKSDDERVGVQPSATIGSRSKQNSKVMHYQGAAILFITSAVLVKKQIRCLPRPAFIVSDAMNRLVFSQHGCPVL